MAVDRERDPAGLVRKRDARDLARGHHGRVEDVHPAIVGVGEPEFGFIGSQADPVAGAAVPLGRALFKACHLDAIALSSRGQVADLEAQQVVDVDEAERLSTVHGEGANARTERAHRPLNLVGLGAGHDQERRVQPRQIGFHEARVADLDGDGDLDILDKPYHWEAPRVDVWINEGR